MINKFLGFSFNNCGKILLVILAVIIVIAMQYSVQLNSVYPDNNVNASVDPIDADTTVVDTTKIDTTATDTADTYFINAHYADSVVMEFYNKITKVPDFKKCELTKSSFDIHKKIYKVYIDVVCENINGFKLPEQIAGFDKHATTMYKVKNENKPGSKTISQTFYSHYLKY